jgi:5-formyltetrahydrofolate cyclo-ligase
LRRSGRRRPVDDPSTTPASHHVQAGEVDSSAKGELRRRLTAARRVVPAATRKAEAAALAASLEGPSLEGLPGTVCAYWPVGGEPGSPELLDGLVHRGCRVLLPLVSPVGPLDWAEYTGVESLQARPLGLLEPTGPRLGCAVIATAVLVLVPALAVDRHGTRLGRGGGHYDQTLPLATPGTPLVAIVRDNEVFASLPVRPHDVAVTAILTPGRGLVPVPY